MCNICVFFFLIFWPYAPYTAGVPGVTSVEADKSYGLENKDYAGFSLSQLGYNHSLIESVYGCHLR